MDHRAQVKQRERESALGEELQSILNSQGATLKKAGNKKRKQRQQAEDELRQLWMMSTSRWLGSEELAQYTREELQGLAAIFRSNLDHWHELRWEDVVRIFEGKPDSLWNGVKSFWKYGSSSPEDSRVLPELIRFQLEKKTGQTVEELLKDRGAFGTLAVVAEALRSIQKELSVRSEYDVPLRLVTASRDAANWVYEASQQMNQIASPEKQKPQDAIASVSQVPSSVPLLGLAFVALLPGAASKSITGVEGGAVQVRTTGQPTNPWSQGSRELPAFGGVAADDVSELLHETKQLLERANENIRQVFPSREEERASTAVTVGEKELKATPTVADSAIEDQSHELQEIQRRADDPKTVLTLGREGALGQIPMGTAQNVETVGRAIVGFLDPLEAGQPVELWLLRSGQSPIKRVYNGGIGGIGLVPCRNDLPYQLPCTSATHTADQIQAYVNGTGGGAIIFVKIGSGGPEHLVLADGPGGVVILNTGPAVIGVGNAVHQDNPDALFYVGDGEGNSFNTKNVLPVFSTPAASSATSASTPASTAQASSSSSTLLASVSSATPAPVTSSEPASQASSATSASTRASTAQASSSSSTASSTLATISSVQASTIVISPSSETTTTKPLSTVSSANTTTLNPGSILDENSSLGVGRWVAIATSASIMSVVLGLVLAKVLYEIQQKKHRKEQNSRESAATSGRDIEAPAEPQTTFLFEEEQKAVETKSLPGEYLNPVFQQQPDYAEVEERDPLEEEQELLETKPLPGEYLEAVSQRKPDYAEVEEQDPLYEEVGAPNSGEPYYNLASVQGIADAIHALVAGGKPVYDQGNIKRIADAIYALANPNSVNDLQSADEEPIYDLGNIVEALQNLAAQGQQGAKDQVVGEKQIYDLGNLGQAIYALANPNSVNDLQSAEEEPIYDLGNIVEALQNLAARRQQEPNDYIWIDGPYGFGSQNSSVRSKASLTDQARIETVSVPGSENHYDNVVQDSDGHLARSADGKVMVQRKPSTINKEALEKRAEEGTPEQTPRRRMGDVVMHPVGFTAARALFG